jgi:hypothetical protein
MSLTVSRLASADLVLEPERTEKTSTVAPLRAAEISSNEFSPVTPLKSRVSVIEFSDSHQGVISHVTLSDKSRTALIELSDNQDYKLSVLDIDIAVKEGPISSDALDVALILAVRCGDIKAIEVLLTEHFYYDESGITREGVNSAERMALAMQSANAEQPPVDLLWGSMILLLHEVSSLHLGTDVSECVSFQKKLLEVFACNRIAAAEIEKCVRKDELLEQKGSIVGVARITVLKKVDWLLEEAEKEATLLVEQARDLEGVLFLEESTRRGTLLLEEATSAGALLQEDATRRESWLISEIKAGRIA